ncbi:thiamine pyrophosphate-binding protein [Lysinibacillus fusiformis]|uniref:thiamine pyrophosphate-binding protein n=1 Tax=Lysinibacillus fusiformis TaxID=28031 RepID=UPI003016D3C6
MEIRVADYITDMLYKAGGEHVFLVTGGMIMHLTDALQQHESQKYTCCHHEQAASMAAEAYGRFTSKLGVAYVTAGPGALNAITGIAGAYVDSSPCILIAGQSKAALAKVQGVRQFPLQGFNSLPMFDNITKYAVMIDNISKVKYEIEKCIYLAKLDRVGPVYIEIPVDIQGAFFNPDNFEGFKPEDINSNSEIDEKVSLKEQVKKVKKEILRSKRPCILVGAGVRLANGIESFHKLIDNVGIPVLTSRLGMDLIDYDHSLFIGRPGTYGDRPANFTIQNSDLLITIGCRLGIGLVGYDFEDFAKNAKKVYVDIDKDEISKPSVVNDISIQADADLFIKMLIEELEDYRFDNVDWLTRTQTWKKKYPVVLPSYAEEKEGVNSYYFVDKLSKHMSNESVFVVDTGSCFHVHAQAFKVKFGQRHIITGGLSTMGYSPASIGVAVANKGKEVYCLTGDGSIQMNLQEFQTIVHNKLPVKFIILNNNGYLLIRHTQNNFMDGRFIGESQDSGISFPEIKKIADTYGIKYMRIESIAEIDSEISKLKEYQGPIICEVITPSNQLLIPRVSSKKLSDGTMMSMPYDDMYPFLPRDEYLSNCIIKN